MRAIGRNQGCHTLRRMGMVVNIFQRKGLDSSSLTSKPSTWLSMRVPVSYPSNDGVSLRSASS